MASVECAASVQVETAQVEPSNRQDYEESTNTSSQASLLGLPPELRNQIYRFVFGNDTIHITTRPCYPYDQGAFRSQVQTFSWAPQSRSWQKWTHTICQEPDDWQVSYKLSQQPGRRSALRDYFTRHDACSLIQDHVQQRAFDALCKDLFERDASAGQECIVSLPSHSPSYRCQHSLATAQRHLGAAEQLRFTDHMKRLYGSVDPEALEQLLAASKLHLDVLLTCKQIYAEAALLPYATRSFNFDYPSTMQDFLTQALQNEQQARAIRSLQTGGWLLEDLVEARECLKGLRYLQYTGDSYSRRQDILQALQTANDAERPRFERVEVILLGADAESQEGAKEMERALMGCDDG